MIHSDTGVVIVIVIVIMIVIVIDHSFISLSGSGSKVIEIGTLESHLACCKKVSCMVKRVKADDI